MKSKFICTVAFGWTLIPSISMTACNTKNRDLERPKVCESTRAKDGEHGAPGYQDADGQDGQKGVLGLDGGHGGNGGNRDWGKGGNGGNGGVAD